MVTCFKITTLVNICCYIVPTPASRNVILLKCSYHIGEYECNVLPYSRLHHSHASSQHLYRLKTQTNKTLKQNDYGVLLKAMVIHSSSRINWLYLIESSMACLKRFTCKWAEKFLRWIAERGARLSDIEFSVSYQ